MRSLQIGDAYIVVGGITTASEGVIADTPRDRLERVLRLAVRLLHEIATFRERFGLPMHLRIGVHSGSVVTGIVGTQRVRFCALALVSCGVTLCPWYLCCLSFLQVSLETPLPLRSGPRSTARSTASRARKRHSASTRRHSSNSTSSHCQQMRRLMTRLVVELHSIGAPCHENASLTSLSLPRCRHSDTTCAIRHGLPLSSGAVGTVLFLKPRR